MITVLVLGTDYEYLCATWARWIRSSVPSGFQGSRHFAERDDNDGLLLLLIRIRVVGAFRGWIFETDE